MLLKFKPKRFGRKPGQIGRKRRVLGVGKREKFQMLLSSKVKVANAKNQN